MVSGCWLLAPGSWLLLLVLFRLLGVIQVCRVSTLLNGGQPAPVDGDGTHRDAGGLTGGRRWHRTTVGEHLPLAQSSP